jgi:SAM-dependent methyltransferase
METAATADKFDLSKVEWESASCPFCGPEAPKTLILRARDQINRLPGEFSLVRCTSCSLAFQDPRPKESSIHYYYPDSTFYFASRGEETVNPLKRRLSDLTLANYFGYEHLGPRSPALRVALAPLYFALFHDQTIPYFRKGGRLLEIGCSHGYRLEKDRRRGWEVVGVEFNEKAAEEARTRHGLDVRGGSIFDHDFEPASFDAVRMDMVLEHVYSPVELIRRVAGWLKPGGELLLTLPYFESFEFAAYGEHSYGLQLPCHIHFFNREHVRRLLADFEPVRFVFQGVDRDITASAGLRFREKGRALDGLIARNRLVRWMAVKPLVFALSVAGRSARVTIRATRK